MAAQVLLQSTKHRDHDSEHDAPRKCTMPPAYHAQPGLIIQSMSLRSDVQIGPRLMTGQVGNTSSYTAMDVAGHMPIKSLHQ